MTTVSRGQVLGKRADSGQLGTVTSYYGTAPFREMTRTSQNRINGNSSVNRSAGRVGGSANGMAVDATGNAFAGAAADKHDAVIMPMTLVTPARADRAQGSPFIAKVTIPPLTAEGTVCFPITRSNGDREINTWPAVRTAIQVTGKVQMDGIKEKLQEMRAGGVTEAAMWSATPERAQVATMADLTFPLPMQLGAPAAGLLGWPVVAGKSNLQMTKLGIETVDTYGGGEPVKVSNEWLAGSGKTVASLESTTLAVWIGRVGAQVDFTKALTPTSVKPLVARPIAYKTVPAPGSRCCIGPATSHHESPYAASQLTAFVYRHPGTKKITTGVVLEDATIARLGHVVSTTGTANRTANAQFYAENEQLPLADRLLGKGALGSARSVAVSINPLYS